MLGKPVIVTLFAFLSSLTLHFQVTSAQPDSQTGQVIIKREAVYLIDPSDYQQTISLEASRQATLKSLVDGVVKVTRFQVGDQVRAQEELIRIDSIEASKVMAQARARLKAAQAVLELQKQKAASGDISQAEVLVAEAELDVAKADVDLAQLQYDRTSVRAPFAGTVYQVNVTDGEFVQATDDLLMVVDSSQLIAKLPVNRKDVTIGSPISVQVEDANVQGQVKAILPLPKEYSGLRRIVETAALAVITFDNSSGVLKSGQTVYSPIVPRLPIIEVPNSSLQNTAEGERYIQVIRDQMIRNVTMDLMGPVGEARSYLSGSIRQTDELIVSSSIPLADGTVISPAFAANPQVTPTGRPGSTPAAGRLPSGRVKARLIEDD